MDAPLEKKREIRENEINSTQASHAAASSSQSVVSIVCAPPYLRIIKCLAVHKGRSVLQHVPGCSPAHCAAPKKCVLQKQISRRTHSSPTVPLSDFCTKLERNMNLLYKPVVRFITLIRIRLYPVSLKICVTILKNNLQ